MNWHWLRFSKSIVLKKQYQKSRTNWIGNFTLYLKKNLNLFKSSPVTWNTTAPYSFNRYDWSKRCLKCYRYSSLISYTSIAVKMYLTMAKLIFFWFSAPADPFFGGTSCFLTRIHWYMYLWQWTWNKRRIPTPCFFVCTKTSRNKHETFFGLNKTHYINC